LEKLFRSHTGEQLEAIEIKGRGAKFVLIL